MTSIDDNIERRLADMARWYHSGDGPRGYYSFTGAYEGLLRDGYREGSSPIMNGEAMQTLDCVLKLPVPLGLVIWARYLRIGPNGEWLGNKEEQEVARRHLKIEPRTYRDRLVLAKRKLRELIWVASYVARQPYPDAA